MQKVVKTSSQSQSVKKSNDDEVIHTFESMKKTKVSVNLPLVLVAFVVIVTGTMTGYVLAKSPGRMSSSNSAANAQPGQKAAKKSVGSCDPKKCTDTAEGKLLEGGIEKGEGTHHLERPGGLSQNVYLTSSTISLDEYVNQNVRVTGETFKVDKAGWFMDVGRLDVL